MPRAWRVVSSALLLGMTALLGAHTAFGWNCTGHMVTARIALARLNPSARAEVDRLLAVPVQPKRILERTADFVTASCWADDVRASGVRRWDSWHYTDIAHSPDQTPLPTKAVPEDVVSAINTCVKTLRNPAAKDQEKAISLRLLIHFVGDAHQPLHAASRYTRDLPGGDRGGNEVKLPGVRNLHAYWDGGLGLLTEVDRPLDTGGQQVLSDLVATIAGAWPAWKLPQRKDLRPETWVREGARTARLDAYAGIVPGVRPDPSYAARLRPIAQKRLALAGYRLAELLNSIYR